MFFNFFLGELVKDGGEEIWKVLLRIVGTLDFGCNRKESDWLSGFMRVGKSETNNIFYIRPSHTS